jgi:cysteinyl-tRNA synthetase
MSDRWLWNEAKPKLSEAGLAHPHQFDIHGGGIDLVFPHHENELAQTRCAFHTLVMANYWMHNGFLQVEGEKMSKSLGNFVTIRELLTNFPGDIIRLQMLMTHYRQPIDWTLRSTQAAMNELENWSMVLRGCYSFKNKSEPTVVADALGDDLNTPYAIAVLRKLFSNAQEGGLSEALVFAANCKLLGFRNLDKPGLFRFGVSGMNVGPERLFDYEPAIQKLRAAIANDVPASTRDEILSSIRARGLDVDIGRGGDITLIQGNRNEVSRRIGQLVEARNAARKTKNFKEADRIRNELLAMGIVLKDSKDGTTWEIAR